MSYEQERRANGMQRVPVQALVEICGRDIGGAPAFEAESIDVSGRGMQLRTAYLPEVGAPLVCRFENGGNEIVVEGAVAWRREQDRGGEFGVKFTALDSGSVEALKQLCGMAGGASSEAAPGQEKDESQAPAGAGMRVRLHIDGLGSPMKACVRTGGHKQIQVSSNLEFLKVGRHLEIEDVGVGERRGAQIDGVDVVIDPQTQVPQLVVALRYDGATDDTPEPSVIDSEDGAEQQGRAAHIGGFTAAAAHTDDDEALDDDFVDAAEMNEDAAAMRGKVANMAVEAGAAAKKGGAMFARLGGAAALGFGRVFKGAGAKMMELRQKKQGDAPRRTTAAAPSGVLSQVGRKLRPQSGAVAEAEPTEIPIEPLAKKRRIKKIAAASALGVLLLTVGVIAMKKPASPPGADAQKDTPAAVAVAAKAGDVTAVDEQGNPVVVKPGADKMAAPGANGASADVPLFGPTPMATMEPAPLGAAPGADDSDEKAADEGDGAKGAEAKEKAAASAAVEDQVFGDSGEGKDDGDDKAGGDSAPWGNGKLHDPVVHRLRLDKAGTKIQGAVNATGFTVVLPGVKVMESPNGIMERDSRIARVKTKNGTSGAEISFQFKDGIPGYKVRLKKDSVEFLISSAAKKGDKGLSSGDGEKKSAKKPASAHAGKKAAKKPSAAKKQAKVGKATAKKKTSKKKAG